MQLRELISDFSYSVIKGSLDIEVTSFTCDSRRISRGCLFVCIHGQEHDGLEFIEDALECQAAVLVTERLSDSIMSLCRDNITCHHKSSDENGAYNYVIGENITIILVANTKKALALISAKFYGNPSDKMTMIGITGTKGKTTTAHMLQSILNTYIPNMCIRSGVIGTNGWTYAGITHNLSHTTPSSWELHSILHQMYEQGCTHVIMEVSSIGIKEQRVYGIHFQYGIYTNLFRDHIGGKEHSSFEEYQYWKSQFFTQCEIAILNQDDFYWREMGKKCNGCIVTYSLENENADNYAQISLEQNHFGSKLNLIKKDKNETQEVFVPILGKGNGYNALAAISCARCCEINIESIVLGIQHTVVKGRTELVCIGDSISIFIDYAHNGESLRQVLVTLRSYHPKRIMCLFGCGGDRSKERRYSMGIASGTEADLTIITEDNSRNEDPKRIMEEIRQGVEEAGGKYVIIPDRAEAIKWVILEAQSGDMILLAGKGHEAYQERCGIRSPFSEHEIVKLYWNERHKHKDSEKVVN